jgi:hypothetical protein
VCQIERRGGAEMKIRKCVRGLSEVVNNVITVCVSDLRYKASQFIVTYNKLLVRTSGGIAHHLQIGKARGPTHQTRASPFLRNVQLVFSHNFCIPTHIDLNE